MAALLLASGLPVLANSIDGRVTNAEGKAMEGVMISAFDHDWRKSTSVFSQADGSFHLDGLRDVKLRVRARLLGQRDKWIEEVKPGTKSLAIGIDRKSVV